MHRVFLYFRRQVALMAGMHQSTMCSGVKPAHTIQTEQQGASRQCVPLRHGPYTSTATQP